MGRLGVLGTMVWDTIRARDVGREAPVEEWGGIAYALSAFEAAAPEEWRMFPIIKVGEDLSERAFRFLHRLGGVDSLDGVRVVPEPNNRVELRYHEASRRCERLSGGVPGWSAEEVRPLAATCDALYVNFIAGWELDLPAARTLREVVGGPVYADLHSLLLSVGPEGHRTLRPLDSWREWLACFDIVQLNEDELETIAGDVGDPWKVVADALGPETRAVVVTLGARGAAWIATADLWRNGLAPGGGEARGSLAPAASGLVESEHRVDSGDPTGCGDVWGLACFVSLLGGHDLEPAIRRANALAARNAAFRGVEGLARVLGSAAGILHSERG